VVDVRIYRATFVVTLLTLVVAMFSIHEQPRPLSSTLAPDAFDEQGAYGALSDILGRQPDRPPGSVGDAAVAGKVTTRLKSLGFETSRDEFSAKADGEDVHMVNVTGVLSGPSDRQLVVLAHRDAASRPSASSAANTAVLLELARALSAVRHQKTLVFVSTDGGTAGGAGARRFAERWPDKGKVDAVLVLDDVAAAYARRPFLVPWSSDSRRASPELVRSANFALAKELGAGAGSESPAGQFVHLAWPVTLREQGALLESGLDAVTMTAHGEVPRAPGTDTLANMSRLRLARVGKAALSTVLALDAARSFSHSPGGYIQFGRQLLPRWALALVVLGLLAPALAAALDGLARAGRRGRPAGRWLRWTLATSVPFLLVLLAARVFELLGWLPTNVGEALSPGTRPAFSETAPVLFALLALFALAWFLLKPLVRGRHRLAREHSPEASIALALVLGLEVAVLWVGNPFAALLLLPVVHLSLLTSLEDGPRRPLAALAASSALLLPAVVLVYYGGRLDLGLDPTHYGLLMLVSLHSVSGVLLGSLIAGSLASAIMLALAQPERSAPAEVTVRGPSSYAGPGSLGGTESALRR
jgi:Peptidase family M28